MQLLLLILEMEIIFSKYLKSLVWFLSCRLRYPLKPHDSTILVPQYKIGKAFPLEEITSRKESFWVNRSRI